VVILYFKKNKQPLEIHGIFCFKQGDFLLDVNFKIPGQSITTIFGAFGSGKLVSRICLINKLRFGRVHK